MHPPPGNPGILPARPLPCATACATFALSLNNDLGDAADSGSACPPRCGKPDGILASPPEPRVQGRSAGIGMAEDVFPIRGRRPGTAGGAPFRAKAAAATMTAMPDAIPSR